MLSWTLQWLALTLVQEVGLLSDYAQVILIILCVWGWNETSVVFLFFLLLVSRSGVTKKPSQSKLWIAFVVEWLLQFMINVGFVSAAIRVWTMMIFASVSRFNAPQTVAERMGEVVFYQTASDRCREPWEDTSGRGSACSGDRYSFLKESSDKRKKKSGVICGLKKLDWKLHIQWGDWCA